MATFQTGLNRVLPSLPGSILPVALWLAVGSTAASWLAVGTSSSLAQTGAEPGDVTWALAEEPSTAEVVPASYSRPTESTLPPAAPTDSRSAAASSGATAVALDERATQSMKRPPKADPRTTDQSSADRSSADRSVFVGRGQADRGPVHTPLALAPARRPLPMDPRSADSGSEATSGSPYRLGGPGWFLALALVLGGTAAALWFGKRAGPLRRGRLPEEIFESLGKAPLSPKLEAHLLRLGGKLVLVGVQAGEARTLTEVTDPAEVQRIVVACAAAQPSAATSRIADAAVDGLPSAGSPSPTPASSQSASASSAAFDRISNGGDTRFDRARDGSAGTSFAANLRRSLSRLETRNA